MATRVNGAGAGNADRGTDRLRVKRIELPRRLVVGRAEPASASPAAGHSR